MKMIDVEKSLPLYSGVRSQLASLDVTVIMVSGGRTVKPAGVGQLFERTLKYLSRDFFDFWNLRWPSPCKIPWTAIHTLHPFCDVDRPYYVGYTILLNPLFHRFSGLPSSCCMLYATRQPLYPYTCIHYCSESGLGVR